MEEAHTAMLVELDELLMNDVELDELLMGLWDSDKERALDFSSCTAPKEASATSSQYDDHSDLSSILPMVPAQAERSAPSTSHCNVDPWTSDTGVAQQQHQTTRANSSSKRSAPEEKRVEGGDSSKRGRKVPCSNFTVVELKMKPGRWIIMPYGQMVAVTDAQAERSASSTSHCYVDPQTSDTGRAVAPSTTTSSKPLVPTARPSARCWKRKEQKASRAARGAGRRRAPTSTRDDQAPPVNPQKIELGSNLLFLFIGNMQEIWLPINICDSYLHVWYTFF